MYRHKIKEAKNKVGHDYENRRNVLYADSLDKLGILKEIPMMELPTDEFFDGFITLDNNERYSFEGLKRKGIVQKICCLRRVSDVSSVMVKPYIGGAD